MSELHISFRTIVGAKKALRLIAAQHNMVLGRYIEHILETQTPLLEVMQQLEKTEKEAKKQKS